MRAFLNDLGVFRFHDLLRRDRDPLSQRSQQRLNFRDIRWNCLRLYNKKSELAVRYDFQPTDHQTYVSGGHFLVRIDVMH